jgi:hypothetical protein
MNGEDRVDLEWGLRQSFIAYVEQLPDGAVTVTDGAAREGGVFRLPGRRLSSDEYAFDGALHFYGHAGVLDVTLAEIRIEAGKVWTHIAGVPIPIAVLGDPGATDDTDGGVSAQFDAVVLTDDGAALLGGVYSAGASADTLTIRPASTRTGP